MSHGAIIPIVFLLFLSIPTMTSAFEPFNLSEGSKVKQWLVLGPFPNPTLKDPGQDNITREGFRTDYLQSLGGEEKARLTVDSTVEISLEGVPHTRNAVVVDSHSDGGVDFQKALGSHENVVAYAYTEIFSVKDETYHLLFGSDDWPRIWVNGKLVHSVFENPQGRGCVPGSEDIEVAFHEGINTILVKVDQLSGLWSFSLEIVDSQTAQQVKAEKERKSQLRLFQDQEIIPDTFMGFLLSEGDFPKLKWRNPDVIERVIGKNDLHVTWYNAELDEVTGVREVGRYLAQIVVTGEKGRKIKRALTFFHPGKDFMPWYLPFKLSIPYIPMNFISKEVWNENQQSVEEFARTSLVNGFMEKEWGAILLSALQEAQPQRQPQTCQLARADVLHMDYHARLKQKVLGVSGMYPELKPVRSRVGSPSTVLRPGTVQEAGFTEGIADRLHQVCKDWIEATSQPFSALVARNGVIVFHAAYGEMNGEAVNNETLFPLASLTKSFTGFLVGQFLDQGLLNVHDPVGKYLPDFPVTGEKILTIHHCLTHTTGLDGHGNWGGLMNPWFDNVVLNGIDLLQPGKVVLYNGLGFDLVGKILELQTGKSVVRLMHERVFQPLQFKDPRIIDLAYGIDCRSIDLAVFGQTLLNHGSYGNLEFMSEKTFQELMPVDVSQYYPALKDKAWEYGLGISWMRDPHPEAGKNGIPEGETILSRSTFAHGAATSAVLRVDPEHQLVVAIGRVTAGPDYNQWLAKFLLTVRDGMK